MIDDINRACAACVDLAGLLSQLEVTLPPPIHGSSFPLLRAAVDDGLNAAPQESLSAHLGRVTAELQTLVKRLSHVAEEEQRYGFNGQSRRLLKETNPPLAPTDAICANPPTAKPPIASFNEALEFGVPSLELVRVDAESKHAPRQRQQGTETQYAAQSLAIHGLLPDTAEMRELLEQLDHVNGTIRALDELMAAGSPAAGATIAMTSHARIAPSIASQGKHLASTPVAPATPATVPGQPAASEATAPGRASDVTKANEGWQRLASNVSISARLRDAEDTARIASMLCSPEVAQHSAPHGESPSPTAPHIACSAMNPCNQKDMIPVEDIWKTHAELPSGTSSNVLALAQTRHHATPPETPSAIVVSQPVLAIANKIPIPAQMGGAITTSPEPVYIASHDDTVASVRCNAGQLVRNEGCGERAHAIQDATMVQMVASCAASTPPLHSSRRPNGARHRVSRGYSRPPSRAPSRAPQGRKAPKQMGGECNDAIENFSQSQAAAVGVAAIVAAAAENAAVPVAPAGAHAQGDDKALPEKSTDAVSINTSSKTSIPKAASMPEQVTTSITASCVTGSDQRQAQAPVTKPATSNVAVDEPCHSRENVLPSDAKTLARSNTALVLAEGESYIERSMCARGKEKGASERTRYQWTLAPQRPLASMPAVDVAQRSEPSKVISAGDAKPKDDTNASLGHEKCPSFSTDMIVAVEPAKGAKHRRFVSWSQKGITAITPSIGSMGIRRSLRLSRVGNKRTIGSQSLGCENGQLVLANVDINGKRVRGRGHSRPPQKSRRRSGGDDADQGINTTDRHPANKRSRLASNGELPLTTPDLQQLVLMDQEPSRSHDLNSLSVLFTGFARGDLTHFRSCVQHLGGTVVRDFPTGDDADESAASAVRVVARSGTGPASTPRTMKYFDARLAGAWVVTSDWVLQSNAAGRWLPEVDFQLPAGEVQQMDQQQRRRGDRTASQSLVVRSPLHAKGLFVGLRLHVPNVHTSKRASTTAASVRAEKRSGSSSGSMRPIDLQNLALRGGAEVLSAIAPAPSATADPPKLSSAARADEAEEASSKGAARRSSSNLLLGGTTGGSSACARGQGRRRESEAIVPYRQPWWRRPIVLLGSNSLPCRQEPSASSAAGSSRRRADRAAANGEALLVDAALRANWSVLPATWFFDSIAAGELLPPPREWLAIAGPVCPQGNRTVADAAPCTAATGVEVRRAESRSSRLAFGGKIPIDVV